MPLHTMAIYFRLQKYEFCNCPPFYRILTDFLTTNFGDFLGRRAFVLDCCSYICAMINSLLRIYLDLESMKCTEIGAENTKSVFLSSMVDAGREAKLIASGKLNGKTLDELL